MLKNISIKKLFNIFDYEIQFNEKNVNILTGPNGYGKTTILNIIYALSNNNFYYFIKLPFELIKIDFGSFKITFTKLSDKETEIIINNNDPVILDTKNILTGDLKDAAYKEFKESCIEMVNKVNSI